MFTETTYSEDDATENAPVARRVHRKRTRQTGLADLGFDWGAIISQGINTAPSIINAAKGNPYSNYNYPRGGVGGSGQTSIGPDGLNTSGGFSINTNTIVIVGLGLLLIWVLKKK